MAASKKFKRYKEERKIKNAHTNERAVMKKGNSNRPTGILRHLKINSVNAGGTIAANKEEINKAIRPGGFGETKTETQINKKVNAGTEINVNRIKPTFKSIRKF